MAWLLSPLRRGYFAVTGLLLFTLPLFAAFRYWTYQLPLCGPVVNGHRWHCLPNDAGVAPLLREGAFYAFFWQGGLPPHDYWPLGLALLGAAVAIDVVMILLGVALRARPRLHGARLPPLSRDV